MGTKVSERMRREVEAEFPEDYALQQVHVARKLLAAQARKSGGLVRLLEKRRAQRVAVPKSSASRR